MSFAMEEWVQTYRRCETWCREGSYVEEVLDDLYEEPYGDIRLSPREQKIANLALFQYLIVREDVRRDRLFREFLERGMDIEMFTCTIEMLMALVEITGRNLLNRIDLRQETLSFTTFYLIYLLAPSYQDFADLSKIYTEYRADAISLFTSLEPMMKTMLSREDEQYYRHLYDLYTDSKTIYFINNTLFRQMDILLARRNGIAEYILCIPFIKISYEKSGFSYRIQMHHHFVASIRSRSNEVVRIFYEDVLGYRFEEDIEENMVVLFDLSVKYENHILKGKCTYIYRHLKEICERNPEMATEVVAREYCYERYLPSVIYYEMYSLFQSFLARKIRPERLMEKNRETFQVVSNTLRLIKKPIFYLILGEETTKPGSFLPSVIQGSLWMELHTAILRVNGVSYDKEKHEGMLIRWVALMKAMGVGQDLFQNQMILYFYIDEGYYRAIRAGLGPSISLSLYHTLLLGLLQRNDGDINMDFLDYMLDRPELLRYNLFNLLVQLPVSKYPLLYQKHQIETHLKRWCTHTEGEGERLSQIQMKPAYFHCFFCNSHFDPRQNTKGYFCEGCGYMAHDKCLFRIFSEMDHHDQWVQECLLCRERSMKRMKTTYKERKQAFYRFFLERAF